MGGGSSPGGASGLQNRVGLLGSPRWVRLPPPSAISAMSTTSLRPPSLDKLLDSAVMQALMDKRYPVYAEADLTIESKDVPHDAMVDEILRALKTSGLLDAPNGLDPADGGETSTIEGKEPA